MDLHSRRHQKAHILNEDSKSSTSDYGSAYTQDDNEEHLQYKLNYLQGLSQQKPSTVARPNIVFFLFDDLGYGDLSSYASSHASGSGSTAIKTPALDQLAQQGTRFTNFYTPASVCTPSRAGMLTGRYAPRAGLHTIAFPSGSMIDRSYKLMGMNTRLPAEEITLADVLKATGYRTGMVGKWHLGDVAPGLPINFGFDFYYGGLYSNDMKPFTIWRSKSDAQTLEKVHDDLQDQSTLTEQYTREAVGFIEAQDQQQEQNPFFLYLPHNFPHIPLFASAEQTGKSAAGLYGDVVEALDAGVAEIVAALKAKGLLDNTLIIVTSDNGPWFQGNPGASRGRKGKSFDGGQRVPFFVRWPGKIAAGAESAALLNGVDLMPTVLALLGLPAPGDRILDGVNVWPQLSGAKPQSDHVMYYFSSAKLEAMRDQRYKYQDEKSYNAGMTNFSIAKGPFLFDYQYDISESYDTSMLAPGHFARLQAAFKEKQRDMEDNPRGWIKTLRE